MASTDQVWIAFIRGINVGGHRKVKMAELRKRMIEAQLYEAKTYIQSGNCICVSSKSAVEVKETIERLLDVHFDCNVPVFVIDRLNLRKLKDENPFSVGDPSRVLFYFALSAIPQATDFSKLSSALTNDEAFEVGSDVVYFHAPQGIGRSKAAELIPKSVPTELTARNLRTIEKMLEMAQEIAL